MPKVSIIVPIFNVEFFIERCADSLFNQTLDSLEFIFIDDCSPDISMMLLKNKINAYQQRITEKNWKVRIEKMTKNSGQAAVRQYGIQLATGDFIIHCDSDDWVDTDIYSQMYKTAIYWDADIVVCDYYITDGVKSVIHKGSSGDVSKLTQEILLRESPGAVWNKLIKRQLFLNHIEYPKGNMGEDFTLSIQLITFAQGKISYLAKPLYYYFNNKNSITKVCKESSIASRLNQVVENVNIIDNFFTQNGLKKQYKHEFIFFKHLQRNTIKSLINQEKYYKIWYNTFPEINIPILFSQYLSFRQRLKLILTYLGIRKGL